MGEVCHRCHSAVAPDATYCGQCGALQLYLSSEHTEESTPDPGAPVSAARASTVDWPLAIRIALVVSGIAAALKLAAMIQPVLDLANFFWILSAAGTSLWLYSRKSPHGRMDGRTGARIGLLVGVGIALLTTFSSAAWLVVARYGLHHGAMLDAEFATVLSKIGEFYTRAGMDPKTQEMIFSLLRSPEGKAGQTLSNAAGRAVEICLFLVFSGALSGMVRGSKRRATQL